MMTARVVERDNSLPHQIRLSLVGCWLGVSCNCMPMLRGGQRKLMGHVKQGEDVMKIYKNPQLHHQPFNPFLEHAVAVVRRYRL